MNLKEKKVYIEHLKEILNHYIKNKVDLTQKLKQNDLMIEILQKQLVELLVRECELKLGF